MLPGTCLHASPAWPIPESLPTRRTHGLFFQAINTLFWQLLWFISVFYSYTHTGLAVSVFQAANEFFRSLSRFYMRYWWKAASNGYPVKFWSRQRRIPITNPSIAALVVLVKSFPTIPASMASSMTGSPIPAVSAVGKPTFSTVPSALRKDPSSSKNSVLVIWSYPKQCSFFN